MSKRRRDAINLSYKLSSLKADPDYTADRSVAPWESTLFKKPTPEEMDVEGSKQAMFSMALTGATRRDFSIDYENPREEMPKYAKGVDELPAFDVGALGFTNPAWDYSRQQVNQTIQGRSSYVLEEGKYDITLENQQQKANATRDMMAKPRRLPASDPPPTRQMQDEINRASLMETISSL